MSVVFACLTNVKFLYFFFFLSFVYVVPVHAMNNSLYQTIDEFTHNSLYVHVAIAQMKLSDVASEWKRWNRYSDAHHKWPMRNELSSNWKPMSKRPNEVVSYASILVKYLPHYHCKLARFFIFISFRRFANRCDEDDDDDDGNRSISL